MNVNCFLFFRMYQEKLQDFKQQLQHLNSGTSTVHITEIFHFVPFYILTPSTLGIMLLFYQYQNLSYYRYVDLGISFVVNIQKIKILAIIYSHELNCWKISRCTLIQCCRRQACALNWLAKCNIVLSAGNFPWVILSKMDTSLRWTWLAGVDRIKFLLFSVTKLSRAGPEGVCLRESSL